MVWWHPDGRPLVGSDWAAQDDRAMLVRLQAAQGSAVLLAFNPQAQDRQVSWPGQTGWQTVFDSSRPAGLSTAHTVSAALLPARSVLVLVED